MPTVPSTPDTQVLPAHDYARRIHGHRPGRVLAPSLSPVPIIAPPADHMPRFPLSDEASAKVRLERLLEREKRAREADGLEGCDGCGVERISKRIEEGCVSDDCGDEDTDDNDDVPHTSDDWELVLGVGESLRRKVIRWILEVWRLSLSVLVDHGFNVVSRCFLYILQLPVHDHALRDPHLARRPVPLLIPCQAPLLPLLASHQLAPRPIPAPSSTCSISYLLLLRLGSMLRTCFSGTFTLFSGSRRTRNQKLKRRGCSNARRSSSERPLMISWAMTVAGSPRRRTAGS